MKSFLKYHIKDRWVLMQQQKSLQEGTRGAPILIFTMAKVGSLSVYSSLKSQRNNPLFHIHSLDEREERKHIKMCRRHGIYPGSRTPVFMLNRELIKLNKPFKVISLFRNPIERNISAFFDSFELHMGMRAENYEGGMETLEDAFHKKLNHNYAISWYEEQFKKGLDIDVFAETFDSEKKYKTIEKGTISVLILSSELDDQIKEELIDNFTKKSGFKLTNVNVTSSLKHASLYDKFKKHIRFSDAYLDHQLNSKYVRHFFSQKDIDQLREKWKK